MGFFRDDRCCTPGAVGDRTTDVRRPDRRPVFTYRRAEIQPLQLLQRRSGTHPPGEKLRLALGDRALDAGWRGDGTACKVIVGQQRTVEVSAEQDSFGQRKRQWPMSVEWRAAGGQGGGMVHVRHFAGLPPGWVELKIFCLPWVTRTLPRHPDIAHLSVRKRFS